MDLNLENIGLGAIAERFDDELIKVIGNILDENTDPKVKRKITVEVSIQPNPEDRETCQMSCKVWSKLAATKTLVSAVSVGMDRRTGEVNAVEHVPRQGSLFPPSEEGGKVVAMGGRQ